MTQKDDMKSRHWEKLWHDIIDDIKLGPLPAELKWRFVQLIIIAGIEDRGGLLPELPDMAFRLRLTEEQLRSDLPTLARRELVELVATTGDRERWKLTGYEKRQAPMTSAERTRRHRNAESYPQSYPQPAASSSASASSSPVTFKKEDTEAEAEADKCNDSLHFRDTTRYTNATATLLQQAGITRNKTTAPLWNMPPDYVEAHLTAAKSPGLAIRKMLDGDPPPRRTTAYDQIIPPQFKDVVIH